MRDRKNHGGVGGGGLLFFFPCTRGKSGNCKWNQVISSSHEECSAFKPLIPMPCMETHFVIIAHSIHALCVVWANSIKCPANINVATLCLHYPLVPSRSVNLQLSPGPLQNPCRDPLHGMANDRCTIIELNFRILAQTFASQ